MTADNITETGHDGIDRSQLETCLSVFEALEDLPPITPTWCAYSGPPRGSTR